MKPPIWERQGRPKPPEVNSIDGMVYTNAFRRPAVCRMEADGAWVAEVSRTQWYAFPTFAEAIAYADREARR